MDNNNKTGGNFFDRVLDFFAYIVVSIKRLFTKRNTTPSEDRLMRKPLGKVQRTGSSIADSTVSHTLSDAQRTHRSASASRSITSAKRANRHVFFSSNEQKFRKVITAIAFSAVAVIGVVLIISAFSHGNGAKKIETPVVTQDEQLTQESETDHIATFTFAGTIKLQEEILKAAKTSDNSYDFNNYLSELGVIFDSDINVVDLVGLVDANGNDIGISGYGKGNYPIELAQTLSDIGINYVNMANSGALNYGFEALCQSIDNLADNDITALGVYKTKESASRVLVKEVNGIKVGIASYYCPNAETYSALLHTQKYAGSTPEQQSFAVKQAAIDDMKDIIAADVATMNSSGAEITFVLLDWGFDESKAYTDDDRNSLAQDLIDMGVDVLIGTGPDYAQKITKKNQKDSTESTYVFYSLGNLLADPDSGETSAKYHSMALTFTLERKVGEKIAVIKDVLCDPIYVNRDGSYTDTNTYLKYRVVPAVKYYSSDHRPVFFTNDQWKSCKKAFDTMNTYATSGKVNVRVGNYDSLFGTKAEEIVEEESFTGTI